LGGTLTLDDATTGAAQVTTFAGGATSGALTLSADGDVTVAGGSILETGTADALGTTGDGTSGLISVTSNNGSVVMTGVTLTTGDASSATTGNATSGLITLLAAVDVDSDTLTTGSADAAEGAATSGAISADASSGNITLTTLETRYAAVTGNGTATSGLIDLSANGANGTLTLNDALTGAGSVAATGNATSGSITLSADGLVTVGSTLETGTAGTVDGDGTSGLISVTSNNGSVSLADTLITGSSTVTNGTAISGLITLSAYVDVNVTGATLTTGSANALEGAATSGAISADASSGNITLTTLSTGGATVTGNGTATSGAIDLTANGANGTLTLGDATTGAGSVVATGNATSGSITLSADGLVTVGSTLDTGVVDTVDGDAASGQISVTSLSGAVDLQGTLTTGGAAVTNGTATSGLIDLGANTAIDANGALTSGNATSGSGSASSGSILLTTLTGNVTLFPSATITTGEAQVTDTAADQTATSGGITISAGASVSAAETMQTGAATIAGADSAGTDTATSGSISITAGTAGVSGGIGLSNADALTVGAASRTGANTTDSATAGSITLTSRDEINNGTSSGALTLTILTPSAGNSTEGSLFITTSQATGSVFITTPNVLNLNTTTAAGSTVDIRVGGTNAMRVVGDVGTVGNSGNITLRTADGSIDISKSISANGSGSIDLRAGGSTSDINILNNVSGALISSGTGTVQVIAGRSILTDSLTGTATEFATSGGLLLDAGGAIGNLTNRVETNVGTLAAISAGPATAGEIFLTQVAAGRALTVGSVTGLDSAASRSGVATAANNNITLSADILEISNAINAGTGVVSITTTNLSMPINLGLENGGLSLKDAEIDLISAGTINIGTSGTGGHTGAISVLGNVSVPLNNLGAAGFNLLNNGTAGADSIVLGATLSAPKPISLSTDLGNIQFNAAGQVVANGSSAADQVVSLTASAGHISGNPTNVDNFIDTPPFANVVADRLNAAGRDGVGVPQALITQVRGIQASTTNASINVYNVGPLNIEGTGIDSGIGATGGNLTLVATNAITQSAPLKTNALAVITLNSPGANITLTDTGNDALGYSLYACLDLPGGCPTDMPVLSTNSRAFGTGTNTDYAAGAISYRDGNGANLTGIGTVSAFSTFVAGDTTITATNIRASSLTLEAGGNITGNLGANMTSLNNDGTGTFSLLAGGYIELSKSTSPTAGTAGFNGSIGTVASPFTSNLTLRAGGDIDIENNIILGTGKTLTMASNDSFSFANGQTVTGATTGGTTLKGNYFVTSGGNISASGVDLNVLGGDTGGVNQSPNGQELSASSGTVTLLHRGVITVQAGTATSDSASGARVLGNFVNIGANGSASNAKRLVLKGGTDAIGYATTDDTDPNISLKQANAVIEAKADTSKTLAEQGGEMLVYLGSDASAPNDLTNLEAGLLAQAGATSLQIIGGDTSATSTSGAPLYVSTIAGLRAETLTLVADGSIVLKGGNSSLTDATGTAIANSDASIAANLKKSITAGGSIILQGGNATWISGTKKFVQASAQIDPSDLFMDIGGNLILVGGIRNATGALASARVSAGNLININIHGSTPYTYSFTSPLLGPTTTVPGGLIMIGGGASGIFDDKGVELLGNASPVIITFTNVGSKYSRLIDTGRGLSVVQTGIDTFDENLLRQAIRAANEETRTREIRQGASGSDLGAPACQ